MVADYTIADSHENSRAIFAIDEISLARYISVMIEEEIEEEIGINKEELGKAIRAARLSQSLGATELARMTGGGCTEASIRDIEAGRNCPSLVRTHAILRALRLRLVIGRVEGRKSLELDSAA